MTPEEYKKLSVKEFTQAANMPVFTKCAKTIILRFWQNWKKNLFMMSWTAAVEPAR